MMERKPLKSGKSLRRNKLRKKGPLATLWDDFRGKKLLRERDEEGLIKCQDWKIGLPSCGIAIPSPDLHHIIGREASPSLYFHHPNLVWLVRECHDAAHNNPRVPSTKAQDDEERQMEATPQRDALLGLQGRSTPRDSGNTGRAVLSGIQSTDAEKLARKSQGGI